MRLENFIYKKKKEISFHSLPSSVSARRPFLALAQLPSPPLRTATASFARPSKESAQLPPSFPWPSSRATAAVRPSPRLSRCQPGPLVSSSPHLPPARPATGSGGRATTVPAPRASWARRPLLGLDLKELSPSRASLSRSPLEFRPRSRTGGPSNRRSEVAGFRRPPPREPPSPSRLRSDFSPW